MNNWIVYMHTTPNGKRYIGITGRSVKARWKNKGYGYFNHCYFWNAIQKYGWENIKHEILFENLTEQEAKNKEIELICFYKSNLKEFGYNQTLGGDGRKGEMSDNQKQILKIANRGKNGFLVEKQVIDIKNDLLKGLSFDDISIKYNIKKSNISSIASGKNYGYIIPEFLQKYTLLKREQKNKFENNICESIKNGLSVNEIVKLMNTTYTRVYKILKDRHIEYLTNKDKQRLREKVIMEYSIGVPKDKILKRYNINNKIFNNYTTGMFTQNRNNRNKEISKQMCELREKGVVVKDIAKMFNCSRDKVQSLTKKFMLEQKFKDIKMVLELRDKGFSNREISKTVKRDIDFVKHWTSERGEKQYVELDNRLHQKS